MKMIGMKMRMRVSELYDDFLLILNSKVILHNERGSTNDITLEWGCISVIFRIVDTQLRIDMTNQSILDLRI